MSSAGRAWQEQGRYELVVLVPRCRTVYFGGDLTESERARVDKLLPYKCRETICKNEYFCTTFLMTNGGELKVFPICEEDMGRGDKSLVTQMGWCPMQNAWVSSWTGFMDHERHRGNRGW